MHNILAYIIIATFVAIIDILPLVFKHRPWRCSCAQFLLSLITGLAVFLLDMEGISWWVAGLVVGLVLTLPQAILPPARGAYPWYGHIANGMAVGFVIALIRHNLPAIAHFFSSAS